MDDKDKFSGETQNIVDTEVRKLLDESYARAKHVLETHRKELNLIANALIEHETLTGAEVVTVSQGKPLDLRERSQKASREPKPIPESKRSSRESQKASKLPPKLSSPPAVASADAHQDKSSKTTPQIQSVPAPRSSPTPPSSPSTPSASRGPPQN